MGVPLKKKQLAERKVLQILKPGFPPLVHPNRIPSSSTDPYTEVTGKCDKNIAWVAINTLKFELFCGCSTAQLDIKVHRSEKMKKTIIAIAAASVLLLSACGSDGSTSDTTVAAADETEMTTEVGTIVEVAIGNENFSTLVTAITAAGLGDALSGEGPFTVFAPTNEAFEALPAGLLEKLLLPENKEVLTKILTYHVVEGKVMAADVAAGDVETLEGSTFTIATEGGVMVNTANVTTTDVPASNGVIHIIDAVLVPASIDVSSL
jgi:uncharacterized surface protein with fasciclin (FAS1) repeats